MEAYNRALFQRNGNPCFGCSPERIAGAFVAHPSLLRREADELVKQGVPAQALERVRGGYIVRTGPDSFAFEEHGKAERAFLFLVKDMHGQPLDVVAWMAATGWLGAWRGAAWAINQEAVYKPRLSEHGALRVHQSPLGWLRTRCRGIVLIRARLAAGFLCDAGPLLVDSVEHGTELKAKLTREPPRILVSMGWGAQ
jgi:hypothetical protein